MNLKVDIISPRNSRFLKIAYQLQSFRVGGANLGLIGMAVLLSIGLSGCLGQGRVVSQPSAPVQNQAEKLPPVEQAKAPSRRQQSINRLLAEAQRALNSDQLTTPEHNNAVDRYRAILLLSPNHPEALAGLERTVQRYCQLAVNAIAEGNLGLAEQYVRRANTIVPGLSVIEQTRARLAQARRTQAAPDPEPIVVAGVERTSEIPLPGQALSQRADSLVEALGQLAERVKNNDLYVLIVARNDAEGRWVYQQMRKAVPDYRLRGNIQLGKIPKIQLQAPLP